MRKMATIVALALCCIPVAFAAERAATPGKDPLQARATLQNAQNQPIGEAVLRQTPHGVLVTVDLHDLPPGEHGFHFHQTGKCVPPFESAGGHFNPTKKHHGFEAAQGPHAGDLPNVFVLENGKGQAEFLARDTTLMPGKPGSLVDADGTAIVVHAGPDDYQTDPAGASGDRIACGTIEKAAKGATSGVPGRSGYETKPEPGGR